jgi:alkylation response protein AidB-like acyl-CoA dehydrogenase
MTAIVPATSVDITASPTTSSTFGDLAPWAEPAWSNDLRSPYYNESHKVIRDYCRKYVNEKILPYNLEWEEKGEAPLEARLAWAKSGMAFGDVPQQYWPKGLSHPSGKSLEELDVFHLMIMTDETSRIEGGVTSSLGGGSVIGVPPIVHYGTDAQKNQWLPGLFDWKTSFCLGITEPSGGSDVGNILTTAIKSVDGKTYLVNGWKKWITGSPWATHMTTAVRTGGPGMGGISVLVIPMNAPGVSRRKIHNSGQNAGGSSMIELDNVVVPVSNLIGTENQGFKIIMKNFNKERFIMSVGCNRKSRTCLSQSIAYAMERHTFGKPLAENQIIRRKFSELAHKIEAHWAWLEQIAYHVQTSPLKWQDPDIAGRIALAKVQGGQMLELAAREAQQVFGGAGYQRGGRGAVVEQISRDLRMMVVGGGSEEIIADLAIRQETALARKKGWKL